MKAGIPVLTAEPGEPPPGLDFKGLGHPASNLGRNVNRHQVNATSSRETLENSGAS